MALGHQMRQIGNMAFGLVFASLGVIAFFNSSSPPGRIFAVFVLVVGLGGVYLAVAASRRRR